MTSSTATGGPGRSYQLDAAGNRDAVDGQAYTADASDAPVNQYTRLPGEGSDRVHDGNGNLRSAAGGLGLVYDYANNLVGDSAGDVVYRFDALGRRIERRAAGGGAASVTRFAYAGPHVVEELGETGAVQASYAYGAGIDEVLEMRRGGASFGYLDDDMGNVLGLTDGTGEVAERYAYGDYGAAAVWAPDGSGGWVEEPGGTALGNPYLFQGRRWDGELGLYHYRARALDPESGRFLQRDPLGIWGDPVHLGNGYAFGNNNPWSVVDPFGLQCEKKEEEEKKEEVKIEPSASEQFWGDVADVAGEILKAFIGVDSAVEGAQEAQELIKDGAERTDFAIDEAIEEASDRHGNHDENFSKNLYEDWVGSGLGGAINAGSGAADSAAQIAAAAAMGGVGAKLEKHHAIPKFLGGAIKQDRVQLPKSVHIEYHKVLATNLKEAGINLPIGTRKGSTEAWANYFIQNKGSQMKALQATYNAALYIDGKHGTNIVEVLEDNIKKYNWINY